MLMYGIYRSSCNVITEYANPNSELLNESLCIEPKEELIWMAIL